MGGTSVESLHLDRYLAVVVCKDGKKFTPLVGANISYSRGYPECFVNLLSIQTEGTIFGDEGHFSGHRDIAVWRNDRRSDVGHASLVKDLDSRERPLEVPFSVPKAWFLPGFNKRALAACREEWLVTTRAFKQGLHFEFAFWPASHRPSDQEIASYYEHLGRGQPIKRFAHSSGPNDLTLALYEGGPNAELDVSFQFDGPLESSADAPVCSAETIELGGPRKTWKN